MSTVLPVSAFAQVPGNRIAANSVAYDKQDKNRLQIKYRTYLEKRFLMMQNEWFSWTPALKDIRRFILPTNGFFYDQIPDIGTGVDFKSILNGAPSRAVNVLAAGMSSGLTSPSRPWFKVGIGNQDLMEEEDVKEWLDLVERVLYQIFAKSNTYGALNSMYSEFGGFGTTAAMILEDFESVIRIKNFTAGEYYLGMDQNQRVNSFARLFYMTIGQLVEEFGFENCTPQVQNNYSMGIVDRPWIKVVHLIEPNDDRIPDKSDFPKKPFRSIHWEWGSPTNMALRVSGYDDIPIVAPRWKVTASSFIYGFGPGHMALGDVKMLNKLERDYLVALDKVIDPPVMLDATVQNEANTLPGGITRSSATTPNAGARPAYQIQPDLEEIQKKIDKTIAAIDSTFFKDIILMLSSSDDPQKTAYEIAKRYEEKMWILGPVIDSTQHELLDPLISRTFQIALRARIIPPPPLSLSGSELKIEYISALAQAQKMYQNTAIQELMQFVGGIVGVMPDAIDNIDIDEVIRIFSRLEGVPPKIVRAADMVQQIRQQKAQAAQAQQAAERAQQLAQGAQTLSKTPLNNGSALDAILGNQGGPAAAAA